MYSIDHFRIKGSRAYGWGWIYYPSRSVKSVKLRAWVNGREYSFPCKYGLNRPDVANYYGNYDAVASGFMLSCKFPFGKISGLVLEVIFQDNSLELIDLNHFLKSEGYYVSRRIALLHRWKDRIYDYLSRGDLRGFLKSVRNKAEQIWQQSKIKKVCIDNLLKVVENSARGSITLIFDHNLGGGANFYRESRINELRSAGKRILLVYYDLPMLEYYVRYIEGADEASFNIETLDYIEELARFVKIEEILFNNAFSYDDPLIIATLLPVLKHETGARLTIAIHDYFTICPSYTLLDYQGNFCGIPSIDQCRQCLPVNRGEFTFLVDNQDIEVWRKAWGTCLQEADTVLCFSRSSVDLLQRAYPDLAEAKFEIRPHSVDYLPQREVYLDCQASLNIGIVGRIAEHKGANIVKEMVRIIESENLPVKITVFGELDGAPLSPILQVTGSYQREKLPELIERAGVNMFFLPSICPETFSFVTEELMLLGVPLAVFDLGAPAERVRTYKKGLIIKEIDAKHALEQLVAFYDGFHGSMPKGALNK